ncbi:hypothetical protein MMC07_000244 [Pseudocyphellaria aurata]|nr:hypothetical protein [Pseudocyphellaria aurata]
MNTFATRSPLQPLHNPHMMSELRRSSRRISANVAPKEDAPIANGVGHDTGRGKDSQTNGSGGKSSKVPVNGGSSKKVGGRGKRKMEYDEENDGFAFARTRSKKPKAETPKQAEPVVEDVQEETVKPAPGKRAKKKSVDPASAVAAEVEPKEKKRRSPRNSGDRQTTADPPPIQVKKRRTKEPKTGEPKTSEAEQPIVASVQQGPESPKPTEHREISWDATKIALPFADTPIIRRNKEMRKGGGNGDRRSSLGMRGRRASSLIDSGKSNALPHDEVDSSEFYKHIESGLPEPRRMRQLLTWCGTRALGEKPSSESEDYHAGFAAREIQQQLLKDFSTKSEMSDWFSRRESTPPPRTPKPNPKNASNLAKIEELEQQIEHLQIERKSWDSLLRPPTAPFLSPPSPTLDPTALSADLLASSSQSALLATLVPEVPSSSTDLSATKPPTESSSADPPNTNTRPSLHATTSAQLQKLTHGLEFEIDKFAESVHLLGSYIDGAGQLAEDVLALSAAALEERDRAGRERAGGAEVGVRDVLRGLSRVID